MILSRDVKVLKQDIKKLQERVEKLENLHQKSSTPTKGLPPLNTSTIHVGEHNTMHHGEQECIMVNKSASWCSAS